jgi:signal transduction histidine kinase
VGASRSAGPSGVPSVRVVGRLPEQFETAAYYVVSEALTNAAKHAHASVVHVWAVTVEDDGDGVLRIRVTDDGRGGAHFAGGSGLVGLKDRVEALGGTLTIESPPGGGTALHAAVPISGGSPAPAPARPTSFMPPTTAEHGPRSRATRQSG